MPPETAERRPLAEAAPRTPAKKSVNNVAASADFLADLDALAEHLRGHLVLQVAIDDEGHRRTRIYRSAAAAERALRRANDRGRRAHVTLCQLLPVGVVVNLGEGERR